MTTNSDREPASSAIAYGPARRSPFKYVPGFLYILALYVAGSFIVPDPRTSWDLWDGYHLSWVEVLLVAAAMMAIGFLWYPPRYDRLSLTDGRSRLGAIMMVPRRAICARAADLHP
jgi:hypothetical protein